MHLKWLTFVFSLHFNPHILNDTLILGLQYSPFQTRVLYDIHYIFPSIFGKLLALYYPSFGMY